MRGIVRISGSALFFTPCGLSEMPLNDDASAGLHRRIQDLEFADEGVYAIMDVSMGEAVMKLERLWHAAPIGESSGCEEDLSNVVYRASGNEPFWGITVYDDGLLVLSTPEEQTSFRVTESTADEDFVNIIAAADGGGDEITMEFASADCQDSMSGAYSSM